MGLFVKKTVEHSANFSLGGSNTLVIAGLGNIGDKYAKTRHNIGFECLDALRESQSEFTDWKSKKALHCDMAEGTFGHTKVLLIKPTTFMNDSGKAVRALLDFYKLPLDKLTVVHDELDLPFGQIRTRRGGSSAGNNGIKSIINHVGDDFNRVRIGIDGSKPEAMETSDYVLARFGKDEEKNLPLLKREVQSILIELVYRGDLYPETRNFII